ncbi:MAG: GIY-YIG nuclease family protein [Ignavibacteriaceae bacterium]
MEKYFYVYILRSLKDFKLYVGYTTDLQNRMKTKL